MVHDRSATTLAQVLDASAGRSAAGKGVVFNAVKLGFGDLAQASKKVAGGLAAMGIQRGDHVAVCMPNCLEWLVLLFACTRLGAAVVVVNIKLAGQELADLINRSDAKALIYKPAPSESQNQKGPDKIRALDNMPLGKLRYFVSVDEGQEVPVLTGLVAGSYSALLQHPLLDSDRARPEDAAIIYSTSGSSGVSKLVVHTQAGISRHLQDVVAALDLEREGTVHFVPLPLAGAYGLTQALVAIASAQTLVLQEKFEPHEAADLIRRHKVSNIYVFDEIIAAIMATSTEARPFPSLNWCAFAIFNPAMHNFVSETEARGVKLVGLYGSSEAQAFFMVQKPDAPLAERIRPGGFTVSAEASFRIRDSDTGEIVPAGVSGEIEVAGPSLLKTYYGNVAANTQLLADAYFRTGDTGYAAPDGSLVYGSRSDDVLRLSGYLVMVGEIQKAVVQTPGISACEVVGVRTEDGNRPVAFVTVATGAHFDPALLKAECAQRLARYKVPIAFHRVQDFPMVGSVNAPKVDKRKLRELALAFLTKV